MEKQQASQSAARQPSQADAEKYLGAGVDPLAPVAGERPETRNSEQPRVAAEWKLPERYILVGDPGIADRAEIRFYEGASLRARGVYKYCAEFFLHVDRACDAWKRRAPIPSDGLISFETVDSPVGSHPFPGEPGAGADRVASPADAGCGDGEPSAAAADVHRKAYRGEPCCRGVDMPGVGTVHAPDCAAGMPFPKAFAAFVDGEADKLVSATQRSLDRLLCELPFAARDLAQQNIRRELGITDRGGHRIVSACRECACAEDKGRLEHASTCVTGRVLGLIDELCRLQGEAGKELAAAEKELDAAEAEARGASVCMHRPLSLRGKSEFGEPWRPGGDSPMSKRGILPRQASSIPLARVGWWSTAIRDRIIACVNACAGISNEQLAMLGNAASRRVSKSAGQRGPVGGAL